MLEKEKWPLGQIPFVLNYSWAAVLWIGSFSATRGSICLKVKIYFILSHTSHSWCANECVWGTHICNTRGFHRLFAPCLRPPKVTHITHTALRETKRKREIQRERELACVHWLNMVEVSFCWEAAMPPGQCVRCNSEDELIRRHGQLSTNVMSAGHNACWGNNYKCVVPYKWQAFTHQSG